jgi:hypothetical protein
VFRRYGKALVAVLGTALTIAYGALSGDQHIDAEEMVQIAIATATAIGVYLVPLTSGQRWAKTGVAAGLSLLQVLATVIMDGLDPSEWVLLALAALTVVGVGAAPAVSDNGVRNRRPRPDRPVGADQPR